MYIFSNILQIYTYIRILCVYLCLYIRYIGVYGGRKPLSRAFRNRFLELCVSDLPYEEVEDIVTHSCGVAPKYSHILVTTMKELQVWPSYTF